MVDLGIVSGCGMAIHHMAGVQTSQGAAPEASPEADACGALVLPSFRLDWPVRRPLNGAIEEFRCLKCLG